MFTLNIDPSKLAGTKIKPMHGVGQPPSKSFFGFDFSMFEYLKDAGIPFSRLHDVAGAFGGSRFVDVPNIFPNFDADPNEPESYDFAFTDKLICALMDCGCEPFYRLGVTIEVNSEIKAYNIYPPKDFKKWARICEGIIAHYTEGWADGYNFDIRYWEIWNEPDNQPEPEKNHMWLGTREQFYEMYTVAAKHLKQRFPHLKIGGYGSCGFYAIQKEKSYQAINPAASPRNEYFLEFFNGFIDYIKENDAPLDFFSWHNYDNVENGQIYAYYVRKRLDDAGFEKAETTCNEWNHRSKLRFTAKHAALVAAQILAFENSPVDSAMFYDARFGVETYGALFNPLTAEPTKAYHAFLGFNRLYQLGNKLELPQDMPEGVHAASATDGKTALLMIANHSDEFVDFEVNSPYPLKECHITDEQHDWENTKYENILPPTSIVLLEYEI